VPVVLALALVGHAQDDGARAQLDRAIKAHGGAEKIGKLTASRVRSKGKLELLGGIEFNQSIAYQLPDKLREELDMEVMGQKVKTVSVFNGKKAAILVNGKPLPLTDAIKDALKDAGHLLEVVRLVKLTTPPYELSALGEARVNDRPAVGVRVARKGRKDVNLFFDKKTNLLAKVEHRVTDPLSGQEQTEERIIVEYETTGALPSAKRVVMNRDGKKFMEIEVLEVQHPDGISDDEFAVPE
jgi:hypothetical protein